MVTKLSRTREFSIGTGYIVKLYPNGHIAIRKKRERKEWFLPVSAVYEYAVKRSFPLPVVKMGLVKRKAFTAD